MSVKRKNGKIDFVIFYIHVDDIIWFSNSTKMLEEEKLALAKRSKVEDLGELHYVLGMSVTRDRRSGTLSLTQTKYLEGVLKRLIRKTASQYPLHPNKEESLNHYERTMS